MSRTMNGVFETRRQAEMAVERLVQEFEIERTDIFITVPGDENSVGSQTAGSDGAAAAPSPVARQDGAHNGPVQVSVDVNDDAVVERVWDAFEEFQATEVEQGP